jgi:hypothetical protein
MQAVADGTITITITNIEIEDLNVVGYPEIYVQTLNPRVAPGRSSTSWSQAKVGWCCDRTASWNSRFDPALSVGRHRLLTCVPA